MDVARFKQQPIMGIVRGVELGQIEPLIETVIEAGLKELVRKKNQKLLRQELGSFDIDLSLGELKKRRAGR